MREENAAPDSGKRVLIIGAGGFIGGFIAAESLRRGFDTWVGVRATTSREFLGDNRLKPVEIDYASASTIAASLSAALPDGQKWDYVVYNLGATKCINFADFNRINYLTFRDTLDALRQTGKIPERLLYMSSLSALGPGDERGYSPLTSAMIPQPNTRYGVSKLKAETLLDMASDIPWTILRPTGVYGPHEQDYLMMIKSIAKGWDFSVGFRRQMLTFIYVEDLARAVFDALVSPDALRKKYIISENRSYTQREFRRIVAAALGKKFVVPVRVPLWILYATSVIAEKIGVAKMKPSTLNRDKYRIMKQRNWSCDTSEAEKDFGFRAKVSLAEGIDATVKSFLNPRLSS